MNAVDVMQSAKEEGRVEDFEGQAEPEQKAQDDHSDSLVLDRSHLTRVT